MDALKSKILELVPDAQTPPGLADVLRAIRTEDLPFLDECEASLLSIWNLTTDYDGQTQEVKEFIDKLLGV